ncbi:hypothetical protein CDAR_480531 [Caerostris darwini]|uniref:Uncharacterized protein n=1 Tax=Caerostris darwini TaxID=1538125 RepID=A0AAV4S6N3_9ARAC|nr:hypothetical protein CDAR_480531 [Caerostris darwini]
MTRADLPGQFCLRGGRPLFGESARPGQTRLAQIQTRSVVTSALVTWVQVLQNSPRDAAEPTPSRTFASLKTSEALGG